MLCPICHKDKSIDALHLWETPDGPKLKCIECHTGSSELEELHIKFSKAIFNSADQIWEKIINAH